MNALSLKSLQILIHLILLIHLIHLNLQIHKIQIHHLSNHYLIHCMNQHQNHRKYQNRLQCRMNHWSIQNHSQILIHNLNLFLNHIHQSKHQSLRLRPRLNLHFLIKQYLSIQNHIFQMNSHLHQMIRLKLQHPIVRNLNHNHHHHHHRQSILHRR